MTARRLAVVLLALYLAALALAASSRAVTASQHGKSGNVDRAVAVLRAEFGTGPTFACFVRIADRETGGTFDPHAANWGDRHADGSRGSFGLMQIGALWRRSGETVEAFARRMFVPRENARLAHRLYRSFGAAPWGGC